MCWTIRTPAPSGEGRAGRSSASARGPPVEQAITTTGAVAIPDPARPRGREARREVAALAGRRVRPAWAASETLRPSSSANASSPWAAVGLATSSNAPSASASTACAPRAEKAETTTTGMDPTRPAPSRRARSTPRPSRPGIARSRVRASGPCSRQAASASSPSAAVATTSKPCRPSASASIRRMSRESSATTTRWAACAGTTPRAPGRFRGRTGRRCRAGPPGGRRSWRSPRSSRGWRSGRPRAGPPRR